VAGGAGTYAALAASLLAPVRLVGAVGDDFPADVLENFRRRNVDLAGVKLVRGGKSFRWGGRYGFDMNVRDTLFTELNVFADFRPIIPEQWWTTEYIFLANIQPDLQMSVVQQVRSPKFVVADTMNFWIENDREALGKLLKHIDLLLLNDAEARQLTGETNLCLAANEILQMGPGYVVIKKGEYGASLVSRNGHFALPALPLPNVVDPTGAGDSFAGGMIGMLAWLDDTKEDALRQALAVGTAMASVCVQDFGIEALKTLTVSSLYERYEELRAMTVFGPCPLDHEEIGEKV
jgi:sugar/nucleoside kinase (ribokinase family)